MNDRYFDEVVRVKLEAVADASVVDEAALGEVLDLADQLSPSQSWWSQLSSSASGNIWWFGAISGIVLAGICWWTLIGDLPVEQEAAIDTEEIIISPQELNISEIVEENQEAESSQLFSSIPNPSSQDTEEELVEVVDSISLIQKNLNIQRIPLTRIHRLEKIPDLSIADIRIVLPTSIPVRLPSFSKKKENSEPPTYHSPSHPNKRRTSKTRPPKNMLERR